MLRIVPHAVPRVGRSYEHFPDGFELHLPHPLQYGDTPMHRAVRLGHEGAVSVLMEAGADREAQDDVSRVANLSDCRVLGDTTHQCSHGDESLSFLLSVFLCDEDSRPLRIAMGVRPLDGERVQSVPDLEEVFCRSGMSFLDVGWRNQSFTRSIPVNVGRFLGCYFDHLLISFESKTVSERTFLKIVVQIK